MGTGNTLGVDTVSGVETLSFADGDLTVTTLAGGAVTLTGSGVGDDITLTGAVGATLEGDAGVDTLTGGSGGDVIDGGLGDDTIDGGLGDDTIDGGEGDDLLFGADGADVIDGNLGDDTIDGGLGDDTIDGGAGADTIDGGDGADTITGAAGSDTITGSLGSDVAVFAGNQSGYTFESSTDGLTVTVTDVMTSDADTITGVETLRFNDGEITVSQDATSSQLVLTGSAGADDITVVGPVAVMVAGLSLIHI